MTVLDVGANVGYYTALAMRGVQAQGIVIALEPDADSFSYLQKTIAANQPANALVKVICLPKAAAAEARDATLFVSTDNRGDNRLYDHEFSSASHRVPTVKLDDLLPELGIQQVNLVKIDVQGFEGFVLRGLEKTLTNSPELILMMEFWPHGLRSAGFDPQEIFNFCHRLGLRVFTLIRSGKLQGVEAPDAVIRAHPGRKFINLVAAKGVSFLDELISR